MSFYTKSGLLRLALLCAISSAAQSALAQRVDYLWSYAEPSGNGRYLFVMLSPDEPQQLDKYVAWLRDGWAESGLEPQDIADADRHVRAEIRREKRLRRTYQASGLYRNNGSTKPLWTVPWYDAANSIRVASDGVHLVRHAFLAWDRSETAVTFYAHGRPLRSYRVSDLLRSNDSIVNTSANAFRWAESVQLNDKTRTLTVMKLNGERTVFNIATGEKVK